jgi:hypothetical protein
MAELKRNFSGADGAKMNKDLDERIIPPGQYRDALNIEIATSEGSNAGTVQNIKGNTKRSAMASGIDSYAIPSTSTCVGSVASLNADKVYYFVAAGGKNSNSTIATAEPSIKKDYIMEYDPVLEKHKYVFVDIYQVNTTPTLQYLAIEGDAFLYLPTTASNVIEVDGVSEDAYYNTTGIRVGMSFTDDHAYTLADGIKVTGIQLVSVDAISFPVWKVSFNKSVYDYLDLNNGLSVSFHAPERVLNFNKNNIITGINILDDFIFWTDNETEPKKINITRSIAGTGGLSLLNFEVDNGTVYDDTIFEGDRDLFHTRLVKGDGTDLVVATKSSMTKPVWVEEKHVTVIKKGPTQPLELKLHSTTAPRINSEGEANPTFGFITELDLFPDILVGSSYSPGDTIQNVTFETPMDFRVGDILRLAAGDLADSSFIFLDDYSLRIQILADSEGPQNNPNINQQSFNVVVLSIGSNINATQTSFKAVLEKSDSLFEFKFPRFSYRYKYQDNEYSTFAPWSQVAFLADTFNFSASKGYNLGMVNQLRSLEIKGYHAGEARMPQDVVEIDILYKETNNPTVYIVKTITAADTNFGSWPTAGIFDGPHEHRGSLIVTTDMVHKVVESNQLLRPWDNVPRVALAQDVSANRLVYGNYLQNYSVPIQPFINVGHEARETADATNIVPPSVKSMRDYSLGVVFSDGYGRETPVLFNSDSNNAVKIPKVGASLKNRLKASLDVSTVIPPWAKYFSYYVKDPTSEYYNLVLDRWYRAEDNFLWLSFPSSERNKVDEETFISLKKINGGEAADTGVGKYKIISIENEAPDYIKTKIVPFGRIFDDSNYLGNGTEGYPVQNTTFFTLPTTQCAAIFGTEFNGNNVTNKSVRFSGDGLRSMSYDISKIQVSPELYTFSLDGRFGADIAFATNYTGLISDAISDIVIDFFDKVIDNKPEYDGRFFVKVNKDADLESSLANLTTTTIEEVEVTNSHGFRYINNNGYDYWTEDNTGGLMPDAPVMNLNGGIASENRHLHPTEYAYHNTNGGDVSYYWGGGDGVDDMTASPLTALIMDDPIEAINNQFVNWDHAWDFWQSVYDTADFFIDGATAYSWCAYNPGYAYGSGSVFDDISVTDSQVGTLTTYSWSGFNTATGGVVTNHSMYMTETEDPGSDAADTNFLWKSPPFGGNAYMAANMKWNKGLPSRAIRDTVVSQGGITVDASYMDFSYVGVHHAPPSDGTGNFEGYAGQNVGGVQQPQAFAHWLSPAGTDMGSEAPEDRNEALEFSQTLTTPGTKFRFQNDPDKTIYTVLDYTYTTEGYANDDYWKNGTVASIGAWGIRNFMPSSAVQGANAPFRVQNDARCLRQRWSIVTVPRIGSGLNGYNPITGTRPANDVNPGPEHGDDSYRRALHHDGTNRDIVEIIQAFNVDGSTFVPNGAIFETIPKESADIDIYYQAGGLVPLQLNDKTNEEYLPLGTTFKVPYRLFLTSPYITHSTHTITEWTDAETIRFTPALPNNIVSSDGSIAYAVDGVQLDADIWGSGDEIVFTKRGNYSLTARMRDAISTVSAYGSVSTDGGDTWTPQDEPIDTIRLHGAQQANDVTVPDIYKLYSQTHYLDWSNCWAFGNGVESDRIRDDFNAPQMDSGVKASSVLETKIKEERRKHGLIWSGIYNSTAGVNDTNQFIAAEKITKDVNPIYGSIQKLYNRDTNLIVFCEDKILRAVTNKDALYNADGNPQLVASNAVIGDIQAYQGDYGISTNPESFVATPYQIYFTDVVRGQVLRLTTEGIVSISDKGMSNYFADICSSDVWRMIGTSDERKKEYNLSILKKISTGDVNYLSDATVSYSEYSKGWVSFKSFVPQGGLSINNKYFTFYNGHIWEHHTNNLHNNFYGIQSESSITAVLNDSPESMKNFVTINYEGSQARVTKFDDLDNVKMLNGEWTTDYGITDTDITTDGEYFNLEAVDGWYVDSITTNKQTCGNIEFKDKEGKWFGYPSGETSDEIDVEEFTVQGLGDATITHGTPGAGESIVITII